MDGEVVLLAEEVAQRVPDGDRLQQVGGDLVQERLERVVVVLVDEHDVHVGVLELACGADAGEAAAEDDDPWALRFRSLHLVLLPPGFEDGERPRTPRLALPRRAAIIQKGRTGVAGVTGDASSGTDDAGGAAPPCNGVWC